MKRGILFALITPLMVVHSGCSRDVDPTLVQSVDSLITKMEAANLTLNELDVEQYHEANVLFERSKVDFIQRFGDTLDRPTSNTLATQYNLLNTAAAMAEDHIAVHNAVSQSVDRLNALRSDLTNGVLQTEKAAEAVGNENFVSTELLNMVHTVLDNYQATQRAIAQQPQVDTLLAQRANTDLRK